MALMPGQAERAVIAIVSTVHACPTKSYGVMGKSSAWGEDTCHLQVLGHDKVGKNSAWLGLAAHRRSPGSSARKRRYSCTTFSLNLSVESSGPIITGETSNTGEVVHLYRREGSKMECTALIYHVRWVDSPTDSWQAPIQRQRIFSEQNVSA